MKEQFSTSPPNNLATKELRLALKGALGQGAVLSEKELELIRLRYGLDDRHPDGLSISEIGIIFGVASWKVRSYLVTAEMKLRQALRNHID